MFDLNPIWSVNPRNVVGNSWSDTTISVWRWRQSSWAWWGVKRNITALKPPTNYHNRPTRSECAKNMKRLFHIATNTYYVHLQKEVTPWPINWSSEPLNLCPPQHLTLLFNTSVNHFKLNRGKNESHLFYIKYNLHKLFKL